MTITYELDLDSFKAWSGAVDTLDRIRREEFLLKNGGRHGKNW